MILSSSTAFFATFSLSPIIIILVNIFGLYFKSDRINNQLFRAIGSTFGTQTAHDIRTIVENFMEMERNWLITLGGAVFFLFVSTTLLGIVKKAIHKVWHIKRKTNFWIKYQGQERGVTLGLILIGGVLFLISLFVDTSLAFSLDYLQTIWPEIAIILVRVLSGLFSVIIVATWFTLLFKWLPEADLCWEVAISGGLLTGTLFSLGEYGLGKILVHARVESIFGASASLALLLLFIFYCSFILYYGAAFTHEYGDAIGKKIRAGKHAQQYEERLIESLD